ncbi:MAG TPA: acetylglutamate kinase [Candidatus Limnocylindria bacterium]|nr:acetylglutamate kinase [Candidatus Limnocylindria bacterium]
MTGGPTTIKIGGIAGTHDDALRTLARQAPADAVIVHGGGQEIERWSRRLGIEQRRHEGLRVTDLDTLEVVIAVLAGLVSTRLVAALAMEGRAAVGLTGVDGHLLRLRARDPGLGAVGEVVGVDVERLEALAGTGLLPVLAPVGVDDDGALLNVNADEAAAAVGAARGGRLLLCTDVAGVQRDGRLVDRLDAAGAEAMLADGSATDGMRPKLRAALHAARAGCEVRIVDGRDPAGLAAALAGAAAGTLVTAA